MSVIVESTETQYWISLAPYDEVLFTFKLDKDITEQTLDMTNIGSLIDAIKTGTNYSVNMAMRGGFVKFSVKNKKIFSIVAESMSFTFTVKVSIEASKGILIEFMETIDNMYKEAISKTIYGRFKGLKHSVSIESLSYDEPRPASDNSSLEEKLFAELQKA